MKPEIRGQKSEVSLKVLPSADAEHAKILEAQFGKAERGMIEVVVLGAALCATRDELKRRAINGGENVSLKAWLAEHLPERKYAAAMRAMTLAENAAKMGKLTGNLDIGWLLTASMGELSSELEAKRAKLERLLAQSSGNQLLLWGKEKDAGSADAKHAPRGPARQVQIEQETAEHFWNDWLVNTHREGMKETSWMHLQPSTIRRIAELAKDLASKVKAAT